MPGAYPAGGLVLFVPGGLVEFGAWGAVASGLCVLVVEEPEALFMP